MIVRKYYPKKEEDDMHHINNDEIGGNTHESNFRWHFYVISCMQLLQSTVMNLLTQYLLHCRKYRFLFIYFLIPLNGFLSCSCFLCAKGHLKYFIFSTPAYFRCAKNVFIWIVKLK